MPYRADRQQRSKSIQLNRSGEEYSLLTIP